MLQEAKTHWASFNSDTAKEVLVSGDVSVGMIYDGFSAKARAERASITYAFPTQGYVVWMDNVVLLNDAPNRDSALKFMDFMLEPENIAAVSNYARYGLGVTGAGDFLDPDGSNATGIKPNYFEACNNMGSQDVQAVYDTIWTNLKN